MTNKNRFIQIVLKMNSNKMINLMQLDIHKFYVRLQLQAYFSSFLIF